MAAALAKKYFRISPVISPLLRECSRLGFIDVKPSLFLILRRMAGHSHWANIKFKKSHIDVARSKIFGRLSCEIIACVRGRYIQAILIISYSLDFSVKRFESQRAGWIGYV